MTTFVTFGQIHRHVINNVVFDKYCVAVLSSRYSKHGRHKAFKYFGSKFCFEYFNECPDLKHFPRGSIWVGDEAIQGLP